MRDRRELKAHPDLCTEVKRLADEYSYSDIAFTNILLGWVTGDIDRVDAAVEQARKEGSHKARLRRSPGKLQAAPGPQETAPAEAANGHPSQTGPD